MDKIARRYMAFFIVNSLMYVAVDKLREAMGHMASNEVLVVIAVIAALSVVSLMTSGACAVIIRYRDELSKLRIAAMLILVALVAILVDVCILILMTTQIAGLETGTLDRLMLAVFCQIAPFALIKWPVDQS
ncbi:hypothetical protein IJJ53_00775 [Candidatus Saccharibacteria bacterium]|nr:hypothetical protein [Candidatus Saccharibacteria bacterium]